MGERTGRPRETVQVPEALETQRNARCFRCPRQRLVDETGWYFMDIPDRRHGGIQLRAYVCPRDYFQFAASERVRWTPILSAQAVEPIDSMTIVPLERASGPSDLIATLSLRGFTGWALLVRDVAEGRIRRLHLRRLPADPKIREAMVAFLNSAGAEITIDRDLLPGSLLENGDSRGAPVG